MESHGKGRTGSQSRKRSGGKKREGCGRRSDGAGWDTHFGGRGTVLPGGLWGVVLGGGQNVPCHMALRLTTRGRGAPGVGWTGLPDGLWKPVVSGQYPGKDEGHG